MKRLVLCLLSGLAVLSSASILYADCSPAATTGDDSIICNNNPPPSSEVGGNTGNDKITITDGTSVDHLDGDSYDGGQFPNASGGNDTLILNGTANLSVNGDMVGAGANNGGNDLIDINGQTNSVVGDGADFDNTGNGGNDTIRINGTVDDFISGDNIGGNGGNDVIIVVGSVGGFIDGDDVGGNGGNDQIIISGSVGGDISGDGAGGTGGDDTITLKNGAHVSGLIDGSDQVNSDILRFDFHTGSENEYNDFKEQFESQVGSSGQITFRGETYTWQNFEQLVNLIRLIHSSNHSNSGSPVPPPPLIVDHSLVSATSSDPNLAVHFLQRDGSVSYPIPPPPDGYHFIGGVFDISAMVNGSGVAHTDTGVTVCFDLTGIPQPVFIGLHYGAPRMWQQIIPLGPGNSCVTLFDLGDVALLAPG